MEKKGQYINRKKKIQTKAYKKTSKVNNNTDEDVADNLIKPQTKINKNNTIIGLIAIIIITFVVYIPTFKNEVTNWDDDKYLTENPLIKDFNGETISKMFFTGTSDELYWMGNYHPLTMLSLNLNYQMLSEDDIEEDLIVNPFVFQFTNILLHIINTILVFFLVFLLFKNFPIAFIASLFFGISTLHVESVSWISERKDVLYTAFYLLSLIFYTKYSEKLENKNLIISFIFFLLSSLSKGQAVSLAITLIAIDYLKNRNLLDVKVIIEKSVYIVVALIFGFIAIKAQRHGMAMQDVAHYGIIKRTIIASWGFFMYIIKLIVPFNLSAIYPYPDIINRTIPGYFAFGLIPSLAAIFGVYYFFKKSKEITFAIAFFIINIALLLQLIPVGSAIMADRYAYIPSIGFFILLGILYQKIVSKNKNYKNILIGLIVLLSGYWAYSTFERTKVWESSMSLWNDVVEKQPKAVVALNNRGSEFDKLASEEKNKKNYDLYEDYKLQSFEDFSNAIEGKPDYSHAFYNRGTAYKDFGETMNDSSYYKKAIDDFDKAIKIDLNFPEAYQNRAITYELLGNLEKALADYNRAIEIQPENYTFYVNRGVIKGKMGNLDAAIEDFNFVIENDPNNSSAFSNRGLANDNLGNFQQAMSDYNIAIELEPDSYTAFYNRSLVKRKIDDFQGAIDDLTKVLELDENNINALLMRANNYIDLKQIENACKDYQTAASLNNSYALQQLQIYCK